MVWLGLGTESKHCWVEKRSCFSFKYLLWKRKLEMFLLIYVFVDLGFKVEGPTDPLQCVDSNSSLCCIFKEGQKVVLCYFDLTSTKTYSFCLQKVIHRQESVGLQSVFLQGVSSSSGGSVGHHRALVPCYQTPVIVWQYKCINTIFNTSVFSCSFWHPNHKKYVNSVLQLFIRAKSGK